MGREQPISIISIRAAWCRRLFRAEGTGDHGWGCHSLEESRMSGVWVDAAEQSLLLAPVECVIIAPWTFPCLPEPWALHREPGTPLPLLPCRGSVVGNTASTGSQQSPLPVCQPLTEGSEWKVTGAAPPRAAIRHQAAS